MRQACLGDQWLVSVRETMPGNSHRIFERRDPAAGDSLMKSELPYRPGHRGARPSLRIVCFAPQGVKLNRDLHHDGSKTPPLTHVTQDVICST